MPAAKPIHDFTSPNWAPLHVVVSPDQVEMFMWMHGCIWTDGFRLEAYKHRITRQYLYLSEDGAAYMAGEDEALHLVDVRSALDAIGDNLEELGCPRATTPDVEAARLEQLAARRRHPRPPRRRRC